MSDPAFRTIKVKTEDYERIHRLLDQIGREGWKSVGAERASRATIADLVTESLDALEARKKSR